MKVCGASMRPPMKIFKIRVEFTKGGAICRRSRCEDECTKLLEVMMMLRIRLKLNDDDCCRKRRFSIANGDDSRRKRFDECKAITASSFLTMKNVVTRLMTVKDCDERRFSGFFGCSGTECTDSR